jgi:hypothetical protein
MRRLFHRSLAATTAAAASLALAACGGGSDNTEATAGTPTAHWSNAAAEEAVGGNPSSEGRVLAVDAGAATQEPL